MNKKVPAILLLALLSAIATNAHSFPPAHFAGAFAHPQSTQASTVPAPPTAPSLDPTPIVAAVAASTNFTNWLTASINTLGTNQAADELKIQGLMTNYGTLASNQAVDEAAIAKIQASASGPASEYLLVTTTNSPVGWGGMTSANTEFQASARTRRQVDFTNVREIRLCVSLYSGVAGASIQVDTGTDQTTWNPLITGMSLANKGLACTSWGPYTGAQADQFIRISGQNTGAAGTPQFWSIALQVR